MASAYASLDGTEHGRDESAATGDDLESSSSSSRSSSSRSSSSRIIASSVEKAAPAHHPDASEDIREDDSKWAKLRVLFAAAAPIMASFFLSFCGGFTTLIFTGHLPKDEAGPTPAQVFAGISLAGMWVNVTYKSLIVGMSGAIETLASQQNGAQQYVQVGFTLQRALAIVGVMCIPCALSWRFSGVFFALMGIESAVVQVIQNYLAIRIFEMPIGVIQVCWEKYLMAQGVMTPPLYSEAHFNVALVCLNLLFIHGGFGFGYRGLGYAIVLSTAAGLGTQLAMSLHHPSVQRTLQPVNWKEIFDLEKAKTFVGLGLPAMAILLSEWWAYEVLTLFAGVLGTEAVAAQTVILSTAALAYMIPLGLGIATASIVGNALGAGRRQVAVDVAHLAFQSIVFIEFAVGLVIFFFGKYFIRMFTDEPEVNRIASSMIVFLSFFVIADGLNSVGTGVLRGCGKQLWGGFTNCLAYYALGLPAAWLLCFNLQWGVDGLMVGLSLGTVSQTFSLLVFVFYFEQSTFTSVLAQAQQQQQQPSMELELAMAKAKGFVIDEEDEP